MRAFKIIGLIAVIAIFVAVAYSSYEDYQKRSSEAGVLANLASICLSQAMYHENSALGGGHFAVNLNALGWKVQNQTTTDKAPENYMYSTDKESLCKAITINNDEVIQESIQIDRWGEISYISK